jgi:MFS family permease
LAGLLSLNITFTVFVVALPTVKADFHTNFSVLTWASTGPLLAFGIAAPFFGKAGDLFGHRRLYLFGLLGAMVSAVLTATAANVGMLLFARALDGVQGAATGTASMALILQLFAPAERVKALGWWALVGAGGPVLGVTIGAPIIQYFGWRALFWGELPLMACAAVLAVIVLPARAAAGGAPTEDAGTECPGSSVAVEPPADGGAPRQGPWSQLDWTGSWTLALAVTAGLLAINEAPSWGFTGPTTLAVAGVSLVALACFVLHEGRTPHPLIPLRYFRRRNFVFPLGARALTNFSYMGGFFLFPILMERVYHYSETRAGLESTARPLLFSLMAPVAGYAAVKVGERLLVVLGALTLTGSMLVFTQLGDHPSQVVILGALALSGVGIGLATPTTVSSSSNEVAADELGVMSAAQQLITQIGIVAGIQVMVTVQASSHGGVGSLASVHRAYAVGAVVAVVAGVSACFMRNTVRTGTDPVPSERTIG